MFSSDPGARPLRRYLLVSLVPVLLVGAAAEFTIRRQTDRTAAAAAASRAVLVADVVVEPVVHLSADEPTVLDDDTRDALRRITDQLALGGSVAGVRVWTRSGQLLFDGADPSADTARVELAESLFAAAEGDASVQRGRVPGRISPFYTADPRRLLTVFVPLHTADGASVVAVAELVIPWAGDYAGQGRLGLRVASAAGALLLWISLATIAAFVTARLRRSELAHRHLAFVDQLTGLPNRRSFTDAAAGTLSTLADHQLSAAVVVLDLQRFTEVNKAVGRERGDELLRHVALRLQGIVQPGQIVARLGGDVFALLLPGVDGDAAMVMLRIIHDVLEADVDVAGVPISFEAAIGVASFPTHGEDIDILLRRADIALQESKRTQAGSEQFSADLDETDPSRLGLAVELRRAILRDELQLAYQPKLNLHDNRVHSVEALVRWNHPELGPIPPSEFVALAEESALIVPLTAWVLDRAIQQASRWAAEGLHLRVAVNVSAKNVRDDRFPEQVIRLLARHELPAPYLELEITETAIIADPDRVARTVRRLRSAGIAMALDDFGQGSTSLAHLRNLPLSTLKIDKCLIDDMCIDAMDGAIVYTMIGLGHQLGLEVVAEGVETEEQFSTLAAWGCDVAQGFYFARPMPPAQISEQFGTPWYLAPEPVASNPVVNARPSP